jgi:hypothetical protein
MAKRILAAVTAVAATLAAALVFCLLFGHGLLILGEDYTRFTAAVVLLALAVYVFRRSRRWPAVFLLVGSVALVVAKTHDVIMWYIFENRLDLITQHPWWWPTCTEDTRIMHALSYLLYPMLSLPVAWFWYSFQFTHRHLTNR